MNHVYKLYLIFGAIVAILLTMYLFTNVYAQERSAYMTDEQYEDWLMAITDACLRDLELPPPPAKMDRIQRREYIKLLRDLKRMRKQMFLTPPKREVLYTQSAVTFGIITKPPAAAHQPVVIVPPPPGWNINEKYIPSYEQLWQLHLKEQRLRSNQRPTKSQRFRSIPKGDAFRR